MFNKKYIVLVLLIVNAILFTGCDDKEKESWSIYVYICGSDLESEYGAATNDLAELTEAELPSNISFIIQTGGAKEWQNDIVDASKIQRYIYNEDGFNLIEEKPSVSMADPETLEDFLRFAENNNSADRKAIIFWNHGSGSLYGALFDELHDYDSLKLDEFKSAFDKVYGKEERSFEFVGFDACLMATIEAADTFSDYANYLIASQEIEPGNGWNYNVLATGISKNPNMSTLEFGKLICDSYKLGCQEMDTDEDITLSVINLNKVPKLIESYEAFGRDILATTTEYPSFFSYVGRLAAKTQNYGGNSRTQGYTNMMDLGGFAYALSDYFEESSKKLIESIEDCVEYKVSGPYKDDAMGISTYYFYSAEPEDLKQYSNIATGEALKYYYTYGLIGKLDNKGIDYIKSMGYEKLLPVVSLDEVDWDNHETELDQDGIVSLNLGESANDILTEIYFDLYYIDQSQDLVACLGYDTNILSDWDSGIFKSNFKGQWPAINGTFLYIEPIYEDENYVMYSSPILLNDEEYNLKFLYDYNNQSFEILGATKDIGENGMSDKHIREIVKGDKLEIINYFASYSAEDTGFEDFVVAKIMVSDELVIEDLDLGESDFLMRFKMMDIRGNIVYSENVSLEYKDGIIYTNN